MHENHRRPLAKARRDYRKARKCLTQLLKLDQEYREQYHHCRSTGLTGHRSFLALQSLNVVILECIEELQGAAEVLEIVEYALRRA